MFTQLFSDNVACHRTVYLRLALINKILLTRPTALKIKTLIIELVIKFSAYRLLICIRNSYKHRYEVSNHNVLELAVH